MKRGRYLFLHLNCSCFLFSNKVNCYFYKEDRKEDKFPLENNFILTNDLLKGRCKLSRNMRSNKIKIPLWTGLPLEGQGSFVCCLQTYADTRNHQIRSQQPTCCVWTFSKPLIPFRRSLCVSIV